mmetsp:Transcript_39714/g.64083  ORF Transcript_39714/g.64083 Transcript_39714/m.64083 type:complete len:218 (-) Transcript_39714:971-1624(-)
MIPISRFSRTNTDMVSHAHMKNWPMKRFALYSRALSKLPKSASYCAPKAPRKPPYSGRSDPKMRTPVIENATSATTKMKRRARISGSARSKVAAIRLSLDVSLANLSSFTHMTRAEREMQLSSCDTQKARFCSLGDVISAGFAISACILRESLTRRKQVVPKKIRFNTSIIFQKDLRYREGPRVLSSTNSCTRCHTIMNATVNSSPSRMWSQVDSNL